MYSRAEFTARRANAAAIRKSLGGLTATIAVVLGVSQLAFIRLFGDRMARAKVLPLEIALFLAYIVVVGFLVWRMDREVTRARVACPHCKARLTDAQADLAAATGKCAHCGAQVIEGAQS